ncbi:MAG TPA: AMP-binding protein [Bacteroidia bacterium]|nr:AMP-binding protein [Bacteroidia bacterium]
MNINFNTLAFENLDKNKDKLAFACSDGEMNWQEFYELVNKILNVFKSIDLSKGHPVIIYGHKEKLFPAAIAACFLYGTPYIPADIIMPEDRVKKIQSISGSEVLINCTHTQLDVSSAITINTKLEVSISRKADFSEAIYTHSTGPLAYIMFTSGSTGEPKGVMIPMQAVKSFVNWFKKDFMANENTVFMNQAPFSFDISLVELLGTLSYGATAVLNDYDTVKNADLFIERIKKYKCSFWNSTPSFAYLYLTAPLFASDNLPTFTDFLFMGEELTAKLVRRLRNAFPVVRIFNAYGPTEATIVTTLIEITPEIADTYHASLPIGHPKPDGEILILNESGNAEEEGEIVIVGDHVSVGYLKQESLSMERFYEYNSRRAYRTGDFGFKKNGLVFYNGRQDDQVKLNGYRIEIGEISKHIENIDFISDAVTVPLKAGTQVKKIVSFATLKGKPVENNTELKDNALQILKTKMPDYMLPSDIIFVDTFPVNSNHKIDKKKLVEMCFS